MFKLSGDLRILVHDIDPVVHTDWVPGSLIIGFGNKEWLSLEWDVEITDDILVLEANLELLLLVDFVAKVDLPFHKEQYLLNIFKLIEQDLTSINLPRFKRQKDP